MLNCKRRRERETPPPASTNGHELQPKRQGNQLKKFRVLGFRLLDLPSSIIIEILTRTPIQEILHCRCVCKTLRSLISDPYFVKHFISRTPFLSILHGSRHNNYHFVNLGGNPKLGSGCKKSKPVNTCFKPESYSLDIIGCSNGVICLWDRFCPRNRKIYITNPVSGEFAVLPNPPSDKYAALDVAYAFCCCPATGQYKIIKIKTRRAFRQLNQRGYYRKTEVWILVVGSDTWKYVGDAPFPYSQTFCDVLVNGRLHWIVDHDLKGPIHLHSLDITEEQAYPVPAPPELSCENPCIELGVLGESLCLFNSSWSSHLEIWSMREYGVATSWTKDCIVTTSIHARILKPLAVQEDGMILMSGHRGSIFSYDTKEGKFNVVYDFDGDGRGKAVLYTPSFLSLKHVSSGASLKVKNVKTHTWWRYV